MAEEQLLIQRAQNGDHDAFRHLVERNKHQVYYLAYDLTGNHQDAQDLSQEVFIKVFGALKKFRADAKLSTWIYRIAVNTWLNIKSTKSYKMKERHESLEVNGSNHPSGHMETTTQSPAKFMEQADVQLHIMEALHTLSPKERAAFILRHYQDQTLKEISTALDITVGTVKSLLFRAIKKLQKNLAAYREELSLEDQ
jgi:RNA polymerase sigma-70 factor (ECF subfamily)